MMNNITLIIMLIGVALFIIIAYFHDFEDSIDKAMDESCYYCIYSTNPHAIRNRNKNTCKINNRNWTSNQIRNCRYRVKK